MSFTSSNPESSHGKGKGKEKIIAAANSPPPFTNGKPLVEEFGNRRIEVSLQSAFARSSDTFSALSTISVVEEDERCLRPERDDSGSRVALVSEVPKRARKIEWQIIWGHQKGIALVIASQFFGALMNLATRLLETEGGGHEMHTFQILFVRMSITVFLSSAYMWWAHIEHFPLGKKEVRILLLFRGFGGFLGVWGLYYSLQYLSLAESIVITFIAPTIACWVCSILIHEPFTRKEQFAGGIALIGVALIARPQTFFPSSTNSMLIDKGFNHGSHQLNSTDSDDNGRLKSVTPNQRFSAIAASLLGVCGAVISYVSIRWIEKRAHPLISVNYFAAWTASISAIALLAIPGVTFRLPSSFREWGFLLFLGTCGFVQQLLLTAGLQHEKSSRATNMVYTHMLFAVAFDKIVWNSTPAALSVVGSSLILGSTIYVAVQNDHAKNSKTRGGRDDEESSSVIIERDEVNEPNSQQDAGLPIGSQEVQLRTMRT